MPTSISIHNPLTVSALLTILSHHPPRYVLKLRSELEDVAADIWGGGSGGGGGSEREQIRSVLADLAKTSGDFKQLAAWALASLTSALMTRIRCGS